MCVVSTRLRPASRLFEERAVKEKPPHRRRPSPAVRAHTHSCMLVTRVSVRMPAGKQNFDGEIHAPFVFAKEPLRAVPASRQLLLSLSAVPAAVRADRVTRLAVYLCPARVCAVRDGGQRWVRRFQAAPHGQKNQQLESAAMGSVRFCACTHTRTPHFFSFPVSPPPPCARSPGALPAARKPETSALARQQTSPPVPSRQPMANKVHTMRAHAPLAAAIVR